MQETLDIARVDAQLHSVQCKVFQQKGSNDLFFLAKAFVSHFKDFQSSFRMSHNAES